MSSRFYFHDWNSRCNKYSQRDIASVSVELKLFKLTCYACINESLRATTKALRDLSVNIEISTCQGFSRLCAHIDLLLKKKELR